MRVRLPATTYRGQAMRLAPRPETLSGKVVGFLDGWGRREADGSTAMYPLMEAVKCLLEKRYALAGTLWLKKPSISKPALPEQMATLLARADVVINGECA